MNTTIEQAVEEAGAWADLDGVVLVGQGRKDDRDCILVLISVEPEEMSERIPETFRGFPVVIEFSDEVNAQ
jgi:hypothetical protein